MLPELARSSPASTISRLVLPEPEGPTSATASPRHDVEVDAAQDVDRPGRGRHGQMQVPDLDERPADGDGIHGGSIWPPLTPRKAVILRLLLLGLLAIAPARAAPLRLLVLGDSLSAGYGLPHGDGFEAQLQAALRAHGHRRADHRRRGLRRHHRRRPGAARLGRWPTAPTRRSSSSAPMTGCAASTPRPPKPT